MLVSIFYGAGGNATQYPQVVALYESLYARLLGISLASFSSGSVNLFIVIATQPHIVGRAGRVDIPAAVNNL